MDLNTEKQSITICEKLREETIEQSIDNEIMLTDYCPDIARILKCSANSKIVNQKISRSTLSLDGNLYLTILYVDENGQIRSFEQPLSYYREIDLKSENVSDAVISSKLDYLNCRAVTPRKIEVHGSLTICAKLYACNTVELMSNVKDDCIQLDMLSENITNYLGSTERHITLNDEYELKSDEKSISYILRSEALVIKEENKVMDGKVVVKGEARITCYYCTDVKLRIDKAIIAIPFTQIIDMQNVDEGSDCNATLNVTSVDVRPRTGSDGEVRNIVASVGINIKLTATKNSEINVIKDAYSIGYEIENNVDNLALQHKSMRINESFDSRNTVDLPRDISSVNDLWCELLSLNTLQESSDLKVKGVVQYSLVVCDTDSSPVYYEKSVEFEHTIRADLNNRIEFNPNVSITDLNYKLVDNTTVDISAKISIEGDVYETSNISFINNIQIKEEKKGESQAPLTVYYAHSGENVFQIARKYNTTLEAVKNANKISENELSSDMMLLIPAFR